VTCVTCVTDACCVTDVTDVTDACSTTYHQAGGSDFVKFPLFYWLSVPPDTSSAFPTDLFQPCLWTNQVEFEAHLCLR
jgi:hypothetical protein